MTFTVKQIPGAVISKYLSISISNKAYTWNEAVEAQASVEYRFKREALAFTMWHRSQIVDKQDVFKMQWKQMTDIWRKPWYSMADAIISAGPKLLEVVKKEEL